MMSLYAGQQLDILNPLLILYSLLSLISLLQDNAGILAILGMIDQCLKTGRKQPWRAASLTNICVGLLAGLKAIFKGICCIPNIPCRRFNYSIFCSSGTAFFAFPAIGVRRVAICTSYFPGG